MVLTGRMKKDVELLKETCNRQTIRSDTEGFFRFLCNSLRNAADIKWIETVFKNIDNDEDRIRALYTNKNIKDPLHASLNRITTLSKEKDPIGAKMNRINADAMIRTGQFENALNFINMSILKAPDNFESEAIDYGGSLLFGYMKRAEIFICLKDYKRAYEDLCLAEQTNDVPPKMRNIIRIKKEDLEKRIEGKEACTIELPAPFNEVQFFPRLVTNRVLPELSGGSNPNPKLKNASVKLDIRETEHAGKEIYAKTDIYPGEVLLIEEPVVSILLQRLIGTHCQECYDRLYAPVGCPNCLYVVFCSRKCRDIALSTYHKYECKILPLIIGSGLSHLTCLAFRAISKEGLDNCLKIHDAINKGKTNDEEIEETKEEVEKKLSKSAKRRQKKKKLAEDQTSDGNKLCDNLASMSLKDEEKPIDTTLYELVNHKSERDPYEMFDRTLVSVFLLRCLQIVNFFKITSPKNVIPNEDEIKVASLILKNMQSFQFNAHMVYEINIKGETLNQNRTLENVALAIYPTVARFNHNCSPGIARYHNGKKVVIRAIKTFKPGDMIPDNYGPHIERNEYYERQVSLLSRYWFKCTCKPCEENWPLATKFTDNMAKLRCPTRGCHKLFKINPLQDKKRVFCNLCRNKVDLFDVLSILRTCEDTYRYAFALLERNEISESVEQIVRALHEFYRIAIPPHSLTHRAQITLMILFGYFGNTYKFPVITSDNVLSDDTIPKSKTNDNEETII